MRFISLILLLFISLQVSFAEAESPEGKKYFDMPVTKWLELPDGEQFESARMLLSLGRQDLSRQQTASVVSCMKIIGTSPVWQTATVGTLVTKCSFDMGVMKSPSEKDWDALVECVKKEVPDFSREELFSLGFSATGASLAKDAGIAPILTPRTRKVLKVIDGCERR